ncbi:hypothetical protein BJV82DRAFT_591010 [Fennellomyces sp. T-0311]|nr:hypothetical protein BJV82DRAFT_591010 [Fennellomyces sp. T-0311]
MTKSAGDPSNSQSRPKPRSKRLQKQKTSFDCRKVEKPETANPGETLLAKVRSWPWWPVLIKSEDQVPPDVRKVKKSPNQHYIFFYGTYEYSAVPLDKLRVFNADWWRARLENDEVEDEEYDGNEERTRTEAVKQALDPEYFEPLHAQVQKQDWEEYMKKEEEEKQKRLELEKADENKRAATQKNGRQPRKKATEQPQRTAATRRSRRRKETQEDQAPQPQEPPVKHENQEQTVKIDSLSQESTIDIESQSNPTQSTPQTPELHLTQDSRETLAHQVDDPQPISEAPLTETEHSIPEAEPVLAPEPIQEQPTQNQSDQSIHKEQPTQPIHEEQPAQATQVLDEVQPITEKQPAHEAQSVQGPLSIEQEQPIPTAEIAQGDKLVQGGQLVEETQPERSTSTRKRGAKRDGSSRQSKRTRRVSHESQSSTDAPVQAESPIDVAIVPISPKRQEPIVPVKSDQEAPFNDLAKLEADDVTNPVDTDQKEKDTDEAHIKMRKRCIFIGHRFQSLLDRFPTSQWPAKDNELMRVAIQDIHIVQPTARAIKVSGTI